MRKVCGSVDHKCERIPINLKLMVPIKDFVHNSDTYDLIRS